MSNRQTFKIKGNLIGGEFRPARDARGEWKAKSPADHEDFLGVFQYSYVDVEAAVRSARDAWETWRKLSIADRIEHLKRVKESIRKKEDDFLELLAREVGKPIWEAKTEFQSVLNKFDISWGEGLKLIEETRISEVLPSTEGWIRFRPLGVMAVVGPFNFPVHLPNGHVVPALLTGNTVVFKPSEKAPLLGQLYAECFAEAGIPRGVFNMIQGEKETSRRLVIHEAVDGVLFTGSYEVGVRIKQDTLHQHWKLLALEMGGKNTSIVFKDADFDQALHDCMVSAFITAGQRCTATSRVLVERPLLDRFIQKLHERAKAFKIGHPFDEPFMGPLIDEGSVDRYIKYQGMAQREGCELIMRGKEWDGGLKGNYVTPSICLQRGMSVEASKKSAFQQTEIFAPNVVVMPFDSLPEAVDQANATPYGLVCSVYTRDQAAFLRAEEDLRFGVINWNRPTIGASSRLPFGGIKKSGNHFPSGVYASRYCTYPVAELRVNEPRFSAPICTGLNWEK